MSAEVFVTFINPHFLRDLVQVVTENPLFCCCLPGLVLFGSFALLGGDNYRKLRKDPSDITQNYVEPPDDLDIA